MRDFEVVINGTDAKRIRANRLILDSENGVVFCQFLDNDDNVVGLVPMDKVVCVLPAPPAVRAEKKQGKPARRSLQATPAELFT